MAFETPAAILGKARGQVWSADVGAAHYDALRATRHVLHAQRYAVRELVSAAFTWRAAGPPRISAAVPAANAQSVLAWLAIGAAAFAASMSFLRRQEPMLS